VSGATLTAPIDLGAGGHPEPPADPVGGGRLTLERRLDRAWEGLRADGAAECPVCQGRMARSGGGGACGDCGTTLS
jgi:hypothetical protein